MPNSVGPRLPLQPLLDAAGEHWVPNRHHRSVRSHERPAPFMLLSMLTGIPRRTLHRYAEAGIPWEVADRACGALGRHPSEVWGGLWYEITNR